MSASVQQLAEAIGAQLDAVNIRNFAYLPDTFTPPVVVVAIDAVDYHLAGGEQSYHFIAYVIVARPSDRAGWQQIEAFMSASGDESVRQALETDQTLGGVCSTSAVHRAGPLRELRINDAVYVSCPFEVEVYT